MWYKALTSCKLLYRIQKLVKTPNQNTGRNKCLNLKNLKDSRFQDIDRDVMNALYCHRGLILAGGAVRDALFGTEISDYDLFLTSEADLEAIEAYFVGQGFSNTFICPQGHLFTYMKGEDFKKPEECVKVQIICKRRYYDMKDLLNSFDFSATYFGMQYDDEKDELVVDRKSVV